MTAADFASALQGAVAYDAVRDMMIRLARVPSPQTELMEAEPQILAFIREAVEPELRAAGVSDIRYDAMGNLIARIGAARSGRRVMMVAHAMNAAAATMPDPYEPKVIDGTPWGLPGEAVLARGVCEQKASMAAMLMAVRAIRDLGVALDGEIVFVVVTSGETGKHDALRNVVEGEGVSADFALICGSSNQVRLGNRGRVDIFITVHGAPSHSGSPARGCNAITGARMVLDRINADAGLPPPHPDLGACTLTPVHVRSFPDATHTVQERCEITLDRRLLPGEDPDEVFAAIAAIAKAVEQTPDPASGQSFRIECVQGPYMYPHLVAEDSDIVHRLCGAAERIAGTRPETYFGESAFDQGYLNHVGIACAPYGPGEDDLAHTDHDMASIDRTVEATKVYALVVLEYLAGE